MNWSGVFILRFRDLLFMLACHCQFTSSNTFYLKARGLAALPMICAFSLSPASHLLWNCCSTTYPSITSDRGLFQSSAAFLSTLEDSTHNALKLHFSDAETLPANHYWQHIFQFANFMHFPLPLLAASDRSPECFELCVLWRIPA